MIDYFLLVLIIALVLVYVLVFSAEARKDIPRHRKPRQEAPKTRCDMCGRFAKDVKLNVTDIERYEIYECRDCKRKYEAK